MTAVLIVAALIVLNALFVSAEFALIGAPRAAVERRGARGERTARLLLTVLHDPVRQDRYIATAQLGITFASLGLGMYGEHALAAWLVPVLEPWGWVGQLGAHAVASAAAVAFLTYLHIVLGEMVPKSLALLHAERTALAVTLPMRAAQAALYPLVLALNGIGNLMLRAAGIERRTATAHVHTADELEMIVRESEEGGLLPASSAEVLRELLEFPDLRAVDVMTPRVAVVGIPDGADHATTADIIAASPHTRYPIFTGDLDHITGVLHVKDILARLVRGEPLAFRAGRTVPFVPETSTLDTIVTAMNGAGTQLAVVLDEHGGTAGIVTIEDLFEEIIGEVEEGRGSGPITRDRRGRLRVWGTARLDEVGEALDMDLEHEDVDSVSGLVLMLLDRPPRIGDVVTYRGVRFRVSAVAGHGVKECWVERLAEPGAAPPTARE